MWLIALALPVQGMAAAIMPLCPPSHHAAPVSLVESPAAAITTAQHPSMHDGMGAHHASDASHADPQDGEAAAGSHHMLKCCSAACSMAAFTVSSLAVRVQQRSPAPLHPLASHYRGVTLDGLDRPPKQILV